MLETTFRFPDNKIYGTIHIIPDSSRQLIDHFFLVVNKHQRIKIDSHYEAFSAAGFNPNRENQSIYIEAIPNESLGSNENKQSKQCNFCFTGEIYALNPTLSFEYLNEKIILVIRWYHLGDNYAQKYTLILDDIEIQHIRQKFIQDTFEIKIEQFASGSKHTFQLVAKLNNGKETYRSNLMEFVVPDMTSSKANELECIIVLNELPPNDLPAYIAAANDRVQEDVTPVVEQQQQQQQQKAPILQKTLISPKKRRTCCENAPHDRFPGIEHYFRLSSSESSDDIDDDDVIVNSTI